MSLTNLGQHKGGFVLAEQVLLLKTSSNCQKRNVIYLERVAKPYFQAVVHWLETIRIGLLGREMYQAIEEQSYQKEIYHWHLNPGHLVSDDEWMSSPIYPDSAICLKVARSFADIIPSVPGYTGVSAEECVALADETLQKEIQQTYPESSGNGLRTQSLFKGETLKIDLPSEVLPMSNLVGYLRLLSS